MREAMFFERLENEEVRCGLCRFRCFIRDGGRGICGVRENRAGILYTLVYGKSIAEHVDPIEKKPLFHFLPGSRTFSFATVGCNFRCLHCQNYSISQPPGEKLAITGIDLPPEEIVGKALDAGCSSISYTYTEPTIFFEYAYDTAVLAKKAGLRNIFVTNGYITAEALERISPFLDAANIDLKGFSQRFYAEVVHAMLDQVLASILEYRRLGIWIELTTLIIPNHNDSEDELTAMARFIAEKVGVDTPWHVTRFHPTFRLTDEARTPVRTLRRAREIGLEAGLRYVYEGNVPGEGGENTYCPGCGKILFERCGFVTGKTDIGSGRCPHCGYVIAGVWE
jgi:pyruvate formate lyase activating enzyme